MPEDTQISPEDLTSAISTYLIDNGYITEDTTRTDEEINSLISAGVSGIETAVADVATDVADVATDVADLGTDLNTRIDDLVNAGVDRATAVDTALSDLATSMGTTEDNILTQLQTTEDNLAEDIAGVATDVAGVATDVAGVATDVADLSELVTTYEEQGLTRDEALSQAITDLSEQLGLTETAFLTSLGETETTLLNKIDTSQAETDEYLGYISSLIGVPASDITQDDINNVVDLLAEDEAITDINNDIRRYDTNYDGRIDQTDIDMLQGLMVDGAGTIPASGLYADAATKADEMQGLVSAEGDRTRGLMTQQNALNMMMGAGDMTGRRVDVTTPDPVDLKYIYDFSDIFATPQQKGLFPSPYGGPQRAQQQQIAQKRGIMSGPLQLQGMASGGKVQGDFSDEVIRIMNFGEG